MKYVFIVLLSTDAQTGLDLFNRGTEELGDIEADFTWNPEPKVWAEPERANEWVEYYERHGVHCVVRHPPAPISEPAFYTSMTEMWN